MINWGIIGAGNIAHRFADSLAQIDDGHLYAVANRTVEKAQAFQEKFPCEKAYGDYNELLQNPQVDIVYIAVPHQYHFEWIQQALRHKKAVLCEKPATMNTKQMSEIKNLAETQNVFFMEAMKNRFVPAFEKIHEMVAVGKIGSITNISTSFCSLMPKENTSYHYLPIQGGCLLDLGIYNASLIESFVEEPLKVTEVESTLDENGVEIYVQARMENSTIQAILETAFNQSKPTEAIIKGTKGEIKFSDLHRPSSFSVELYGDSTTAYNYPYIIDDFAGEIQEAMECFKKGDFESQRMSHQASINCIEIIDDIKEKI